MPLVLRKVSSSRSQASRTSVVVTFLMARSTEAPAIFNTANASAYVCESFKALSKIEGLVVTPTTEYFSIKFFSEESIPGFIRRDLDRSSSQTEVPSDDKFFSAFDITKHLQRVRQLVRW